MDVKRANDTQRQTDRTREAAARFSDGLAADLVQAIRRAASMAGVDDRTGAEVISALITQQHVPAFGQFSDRLYGGEPINRLLYASLKAQIYGALEKSGALEMSF